MRHLAFLIAVIAWLFQSLMPALALPAAHDHAMASSMMDAMPHAHGRHAPESTARAAFPSGNVAHHACPDCGAKPAKAACAMSLCAACTPLTPEMILPASAPVVASLLKPLPAPPMPGRTPGPIDPPPRS